MQLNDQGLLASVRDFPGIYLSLSYGKLDCGNFYVKRVAIKDDWYEVEANMMEYWIASI